MTKKLLLVIVLFIIGLTGVFADSADYFTFTMGAGAGYDFVADDAVTEMVFGVDYIFNDMFTGGFKFFTLGANSVTAMNFSVEVIENATVSLYSGVDSGTDIVFGLGFGYDFLTKKDTVFSSMGLYIDWIAGNGGFFDIMDGGSFLMGVRAKFGL